MVLLFRRPSSGETSWSNWTTIGTVLNDRDQWIQCTNFDGLGVREIEGNFDETIPSAEVLDRCMHKSFSVFISIYLIIHISIRYS